MIYPNALRRASVLAVPCPETRRVVSANSRGISGEVHMRLRTFGLSTLALLLAVAVFGYLAAEHWANATSPPNAQAAAVDMDPGATPANTCTPASGSVPGSCVLGTIQPCAQIVENNIQDAD